MLEIGILKNFDSGTYKAGVQLAGSITTYFDDISVARNIPAAAMVAGNYVIVAIPGGNPKDAVVIATWPQGSPGGGTFLDLSDTPSSYSGQAGKLVKVNSGQTALQFGNTGYLFKPMAAAETNIWRFPAIGDTNSTATVSSVLDDVITLTTDVADQFFTNRMEGFVYLLIRNTTRSQNAWVKAYVAANQLQVTDSNDISTWQSGDTIRGYSENISWGHYSYTDIDLTPSLGLNAKHVFLYTYLKDTAANSQNIIFGAAGNFAVISQNANIYNTATGVLTLYPGRQLAVRTIAADTSLESVAICLAYTEEI